MDWAGVREGLGADWLAGMPADEATGAGAALDQIVADWAREADGTPDPQAVLRFQQEDLAALLASVPAHQRLAALRARVLGRRLDRAGSASYALGQAVVDGSIVPEEAQRQGQALLEEIEHVAREAKALPEALAGPLRQELSEASMEARYAIDGQAMSPRLDRYRRSAGSGDDAPVPGTDEGPPSAR